MAPTRKSWCIDRIRRQFYSVFKERLNAAWAAYWPYCFSITNFGNTGVPGKPDFGLLGWKSGDFGIEQPGDRSLISAVLRVSALPWFGFSDLVR